MNLETILAILLGLATGTAHAQGQPDLSDLITDSVGYQVLRDGVMMIEGDTMGTWFCRIDIPDTAFDNYAPGATDWTAGVNTVCIPVEEIEQ